MKSGQSYHVRIEGGTYAFEVAEVLASATDHTPHGGSHKLRWHELEVVRTRAGDVVLRRALCYAAREAPSREIYQRLRGLWDVLNILSVDGHAARWPRERPLAAHLEPELVAQLEAKGFAGPESGR